MKNNKKKLKIDFYFLVIVFIFVFFVFNFIFSEEIYSQTENLEKLCEIQNIEQQAKVLPQTDYRKLLEKCQKYYEEKTAQIEKDISKTKQEKKTLKNQIHILKKKIEKLNLQIQESNVMIKDLSLQIKDTEASINKTSLKIEESHQQLVSILRAIYEKDQKSLVEILLSERTLSDFFNDLMALETLNLKSQELLKDIKNLKSYLETQKQLLEKEKTELERLLKIHLLQKKENEEIKKDKEYFLKLTEAQYQKYLKEKQETEKKAVEIRARIWELVGVREAPTYEQAVEVAKEIYKITGIRPAFLLGILTQESRIGKFVSQCYLRDPKTGMGINYKKNKIWPRVMNPNWVPLFFKTIELLNQEKKLNLDPFTTPISCWIPACVNNNYHVTTYNVLVDSLGNITCPPGYKPFGWGGAMGPAQLMPFNWVGSDNYKGRIEAITKKPADPWDFYDASLGAALHLKDCRADLSEREAAACYFGGWGNRKRSYHLREYADPVMALTKCHQQFIDTGSMSAWCEKRIF